MLHHSSHSARSLQGADWFFQSPSFPAQEQPPNSLSTETIEEPFNDLATACAVDPRQLHSLPSLQVGPEIQAYPGVFVPDADTSSTPRAMTPVTAIYCPPEGDGQGLLDVYLDSAIAEEWRRGELGHDQPRHPHRPASFAEDPAAAVHPFEQLGGEAGGYEQRDGREAVLIRETHSMLSWAVKQMIEIGERQDELAT